MVATTGSNPTVHLNQERWTLRNSAQLRNPGELTTATRLCANERQPGQRGSSPWPLTFRPKGQHRGCQLSSVDCRILPTCRKSPNYSLSTRQPREMGGG